MFRDMSQTNSDLVESIRTHYSKRYTLGWMKLRTLGY
jgi:hypothetical protein